MENRMIDVMKRALKTFEKIHEGCAFVKEDDLHKDAKDLATYVQEDCEFTMRTLRQAIEQAEKESTLQEISDIGQEAHTDHPMRHWDRTCPACVAEVEKQEPVSRLYSIEPHGNGYAIYFGRDWQHHGMNIGHLTEITPDTIKLIADALNAAPPKREWVGLTGLEVSHYNSRLSRSGVAEEIQAKLRERNT
jgi:hypothetical protein